jgi:hypothetical protein
MLLSSNQNMLMQSSKLEFSIASQSKGEGKPYLGKIKEKNGVFTLFDDGKTTGDKIREEIGAVVYDMTIDNSKRPRELKVRSRHYMG